LKNFREKVGWQWESFIVAHDLIYRAEFGGFLSAHSIDNSKSNPPSWDKSQEKNEEEENTEEVEE